MFKEKTNYPDFLHIRMRSYLLVCVPKWCDFVVGQASNYASLGLRRHLVLPYRG